VIPFEVQSAGSRIHRPPASEAFDDPVIIAT